MPLANGIMGDQGFVVINYFQMLIKMTDGRPLTECYHYVHLLCFCSLGVAIRDVSLAFFYVSE